MSRSAARMRDFDAEFRVAAPPAQVWAILTDLPCYREWNPFLREARGEIREGGRVLLQMRPPGGNPLRFTVRVDQVEETRRVRWVAHLAADSLFRAVHEFRLEPVGQRATRLQVSAHFSGALAGLVPGFLYRRQHHGLERMAEAMQERAATGA